MANASAQLAGVAARLKVAGAGELRLQLLRGLKAGAKPLIADVRTAATRQLPKRGGLNRQVANSRMSVSVRTGARTAGVRLTTAAPDTKQTDAGYVRHPVFGHKDRYVAQQIPAARGWWSVTLANGAPKVTPQLVAVLDEVAAKVMGF